LALAGGLIGNACFALGFVAVALLLPALAPVAYTAAVVNFLFVLGNAFPVEIRVGRVRVRNDVAQIRLLLRAKRGRGTPETAEPVTVVRLTNMTCKLLRAVGDERMLALYLDQAIQARVSLNEFETAYTLCAEARGLSLNRDPYRQGLVRYHAGFAAAAAGRVAVALSELDEADRLFRESGADSSSAMTMARAIIALKQGEGRRASEMLDQLASSPVVLLNPAAGLPLLANRIWLRAEIQDRAGVEALLGRYEDDRLAWPDKARDFIVWEALAKLYVRDQDWGRAETYCRKALNQLREFNRALADREEEALLVGCHAPLVEAARTCWQQRGRDGWGDVEAGLRPVAAARRRREEAERLGGRFRRISFALALCHLGLALAVAVSLFDPEEYQRQRLMIGGFDALIAFLGKHYALGSLAVVLAGYSFVVLLSQGFQTLIVRRELPVVPGGKWLLLHWLLPWWVWLLVLPFARL
jgi:tetratricopeptide (TPR) repeat protein